MFSSAWLYVSLIGFTVMLVSVFSFISYNEYESHSLDEYGCDVIKESIRTGDCLMKVTNGFRIDCFESDEKYIYITMFCKDRR